MQEIFRQEAGGLGYESGETSPKEMRPEAVPPPPQKPDDKFKIFTEEDDGKTPPPTPDNQTEKRFEA